MAVRKNIFCTVYRLSPSYRKNVYLKDHLETAAQRQLGKMFICICFLY